MVAARRVITLSIDPDQRRALVDISRSRSEATGRVERARMIIAYLDTPSAYVVARQIGVSQQTVTRCLERAAELGVLAALDDRPRAGRDAVITREARAWLVSLACAKPIASGYPHELWTTRLLAAHARNHGPQAGHPSLAKLAQGTVCKILAAHEIKPHKIRYYVEQRDPDFEPKMAEVLCVYREVEMRRAAAADRDGGGQIAILSYDEKPGIQAIGNTTPDLPPVPGTHPTTQRDHEYKRHGTVTLMAGIDLLTGTVHCARQGPPSQSRVHRVPQNPRHCLPGRNGDQSYSGQSLGAHLAGDQDVAGRSAGRPLRVCVHPQTRFLAQPHRGVFLQSSPLRAPPHPCQVHTRIEATHHRIHQ